MSFPNPNNPYGFDDFLEWRENCDFYAEDPFAQKAVRVFTGERADEVDAAAREISKKVSFRWRNNGRRYCLAGKTALDDAL